MSIKTPRLTRDRCGVFDICLVVPLALDADQSFNNRFIKSVG